MDHKTWSITDLLAAFEKASYERNEQEAVNVFCELLMAMHKSNNVPQEIRRPHVSNRYYLQFAGAIDRMVSAWLNLLLDPKTDFSKLQLSRIIPLLVYLHEVYMATPMQEMDYAIRILKERTGGNFDPNNLIKLLLLYTPNTSSSIDLTQFVNVAPMLVYAQLLAVIGANNFVDEKTWENRNKAMQYLNTNPSLDRHAEGLLDLCAVIFESAWMHCTYSDQPNKHDIKLRLNQVIKNRHQSQIQSLRKQVPEKEGHRVNGKPVIAVVMEVLTSGHAVERCLGLIIENLKTRFHVVGFGWHDSTDESAGKYFDELIVFPERKDEIPDYIASCGQKVIDVKPSAVFYPTLGMRYYAILLANYRLCSIQAMTTGHPATAGGAEIDYVVIEEELIGDPGNFTEKVISLNSQGYMMIPHADMNSVPADIREDAEVVRVAVSAMSMKLNRPFINTLLEVEALARKPVEFHFMTAKSGNGFVLLTNLMQKTFDRVKVYPLLKYTDYLDLLNQQDLYASSFPFGGTNSILDAFSLGLPVVSLAGNEPCGLVDKVFTERLGLDYNLVASSHEEYRDILLDLIENDSKRVETSREILERSVLEGELYQSDLQDNTDALAWIVDHHEEVQSSEKQLWRTEDRT